MSRWTRPYRQPDLLVRHAVAAVVSVAYGSAIVSRSASIETRWFPAVVLAVYAAAVVLQFRVNMQGLAVGEPGVRIRFVWRTRVVPWSAVLRALVVEDPRYRNRVVVIDTIYGERIRTPIFRQNARPFRSTAPLGSVTLTGAELDTLAQAVDGMAAVRNGRVIA